MGNRYKIIAAALGVLTSFVCAPSQAAVSLIDDPMIAGAKECTRYFSRHERTNGIPVHLLAAIASTESGRWHSQLGMSLPWPWTINAQGKGYYFATKEEAIAAVQRLHKRGVDSVDVGCMQVNLRHHPEAFKSLDEAFDPAVNVGYAATFLRNNFNESQSWRQAAAYYHSRTPSLGSKYVGRVFNNWSTIINKLAEARGARVNAAELDSFQRPQFSRVESVDEVAEAQPELQTKRSARRVVAENKRAKVISTFRAKRTKQIALSSRDLTKENGVLVIRPEIEKLPVIEKDDATVTIAQNDKATVIADSGIVTSERVLQPKHIKMDEAPRTSSRARGPNFIFNN